MEKNGSFGYSRSHIYLDKTVCSELRWDIVVTVINIQIVKSYNPTLLLNQPESNSGLSQTKAIRNTLGYTCIKLLHWWETSTMENNRIHSNFSMQKLAF